MLIKIYKLQSIGPLFPAEVEKHLLLKVVLSVVDGNRIVVPVQTVDEACQGWLVEMANVGSCLTWLLSEHHSLLANEPKAINDDLALHGLDRVHDDPDGPWIQLLEALLRVHVRAREPAAEARVGVVPAHNHFRPARLLEQIKHLCLEDGIHSLNTDAVSGLWHREYVNNADSIIINEFTEHEPHDLHGDAHAPVLQHLQQRKRRDIHLLCGVGDRCIWFWACLSSPHTGDVPQNSLQVEVCHCLGRKSICQAGHTPRGRCPWLNGLCHLMAA
mmetsp:Transcript_59061/g.103359  ORF Transcript_59061/g.103359 Transcript_59061/m.103359 type:complete len:273 (+) Transcript_59061:351-1169(+)